VGTAHRFQQAQQRAKWWAVPTLRGFYVLFENVGRGMNLAPAAFLIIERQIIELQIIKYDSFILIYKECTHDTKRGNHRQ
jgi:hypothetical protein